MDQIGKSEHVAGKRDGDALLIFTSLGVHLSLQQWSSDRLLSVLQWRGRTEAKASHMLHLTANIWHDTASMIAGWLMTITMFEFRLYITFMYSCKNKKSCWSGSTCVIVILAASLRVCDWKSVAVVARPPFRHTVVTWKKSVCISFSFCFFSLSCLWTQDCGFGHGGWKVNKQAELLWIINGWWQCSCCW